jgi:hypothetical protein
MDFLNSLNIEEQPIDLLPIDGEGNLLEQPNIPLQPLEENPTPSAPKAEEKPISQDNGLMPLNLEEMASEEVKKQSNSTTGVSYKEIINKIADKVGFDKEQLNLEEFEDSEETLTHFVENVLYETAEKMTDDYIKTNLSEYQKRFVNLVENGVSEEAAASLVKDYKTFKSIDKESIADDSKVAASVYRLYLEKTTKFSPEKITKEVEDAIDLGYIEKKALESYDEVESILNQEEQELIEGVKRQEQAQAIKTQEELQKLANYIDTTEVLGDIKLNKIARNKWANEFTPSAEYNGQKVAPIIATKMQDPVKFDALLRLYHSMGLFNFDKKTGDFKPDFTTLSSTFNKRAVGEFKKAVNQEAVRRSVSNQDTSTDVSGLSKDDYLKRFEKLGIN